MGQAIPYDVRLKIVERKKLKHSNNDIASELGYSESGIKKIWYTYKKAGNECLKTKFSNCGRHSPYEKIIFSYIDEVRDNEQGAGYVRSKLVQKYPDLKLPHERTIQRWWVKSKTNRKRGKPSKKEKKMVSEST